MGERWTLNRAGILNVYQYGDETLTFAGGRLLLRGVNGSGKSTAMNMLLPFLLDGDTRKIDAAGEQAGVLKSWMLSGRDDAQPIGYLWVEFARGDEHLTCGCGIKANRAADSVSTWWWVTPRRPGIDLDLVADRRPLSLEALRAVLGPDAVFRQEDRRSYREEVRRRLFGGAELEQYIRLLHVVRNPRVGDRIDQDLPSYLEESLPQLSEAALMDAAQPLDDLEEHRRNVEDLGRTATALAGLKEVYGDYARSELRRRAAQAQDVAASAARARGAAKSAEADLRRAELEMSNATDRVGDLDATQRRLNEELQSLRDAPAYQEGRQLDDLREHVKGLREAASGAAEQLASRHNAQREAAGELVSNARTAREDHDELVGQLEDLAEEALAAGLSAGPPDVPQLVNETLDEEGPLEAPGPLPSETLPDRLALVRAAVAHRQGDVDEVRTELALVAAALSRLDSADVRLEAARADVGGAQATLDEHSAALDRSVSEWRGALSAWRTSVDARLRDAGLAPGPPVELGTGLADRRVEVHATLLELADRLVGHHEQRVATLTATEGQRQEDVDARSEELAALEATVLPDAPAQAWQRPDRGPLLSEVVDFAADTDETVRAAIEAAMEASGLLHAELTATGGLALPVGTLLATPSAPAPQPLSRSLVALPEADPALARVLASISTDPADLERDGATVVTTDGRFRVGVLVGQHEKERSEHIGLAARRATLERRKEEARRLLAEATDALQRVRAELAAATEVLVETRAQRVGLPSHEPIGHALAAHQGALAALGRAEERLEERARQHRQAEEAHAEAVDKSRRVAANLGLVAEEDHLATVEQAGRAAGNLCDRCGFAFDALRRSLEQWSRTATRWGRCRDDTAAATDKLEEARRAHEQQAARLATLEDSVGVAYREIRATIEAAERELATTEEELGNARKAELACNTTLSEACSRLGTCRASAAEEEGRALATLPRLRRALDVPGLVASVPSETPWVAGPVEESIDGLQRLAGALERFVSTGTGRDITADGVRQSLRQRRDSLGAGWDAEDRQPDESLPLMVEINGPAGHMPLPDAADLVESRRAELSALLSSEQDNALRNLLQGLVARELAEKLHAAADLVERINARLDTVTTAHGVGVRVRWRRREGLEPDRVEMLSLLSKPPDLRTLDEDARLRTTIASQLDYARRENPDASYSELVGRILDYREWHEIGLLLRRPGRPDERLGRRTALSEGEKKIVSYLPLFAAVAAWCDSLAEAAPDAPRFLLLDDAFAKVSEDNHPKLFGILVDLDLDFIATSERLWGTHASVPELAIIEVVRDSSLGVIVLEHARWDGATLAQR